MKRIAIFSLLLSSAAMPILAEQPTPPSPVPTPSPMMYSQLRGTPVPAQRVLATDACTPTPNADCPMPVGPVITPTATAAPSPRLPRSTEKERFVEARYGSFGNRWTSAPYNDGVKATFGLAPYQSSLPSGYPNQYSVLTSQALYKDNLWAPGQQAEDFAHRLIFMDGSVSMSIANVEPGLDKTRIFNSGVNENYVAAKYSLGVYNQATIIRGASYFDQYNAFGAAIFGTANLYSQKLVDTTVDPGTPPWQSHNVWVHQLVGAETGALVGKQITPDLSEANGPVDGRNIAIKEDTEQMWDIAPAAVRFMMGATNAAWIDNRRMDLCLEGYDASGGEPTQMGYVGEAYGARNFVTSAIRGSWLNVNNAYGTMSTFAISDVFDQSPGSPDERAGSRIRSWVAFEARAPYLAGDNCCEIRIDTSNAMRAWDPNPCGDGGVPTESAALLHDDFSTAETYVPEQYAAMVAKADVVLGDGVGSAPGRGYNTDVVHINDTLHLVPRTAPPVFSENVTPADRVGLLYFDATRNTMRLSVAMPTTGKDITNWQSAEVAWVDVALDWSTADPATDIVGGQDEKSSLRQQPAEAMLDAHQLAKETAKAATSAYVAPSITPVVATDLLRKDDGVAPVTLLLSGFHGRVPRVFYSIPSEGPNIGRAVNWQEISGITAEPGTDNTVLSGVIRLGADLADDIASGQKLHIMAVHPETGTARGSALRIN